MKFKSIVAPDPSRLSCPGLLSKFPGASVVTCSLRAIITRGFRAVVSETRAGDQVGSFCSLCAVLRKKGCGTRVLSRTVGTAFGGHRAGCVRGRITFDLTFTGGPGLGVE